MLTWLESFITWGKALENPLIQGDLPKIFKVTQYNQLGQLEWRGGFESVLCRGVWSLGPPKNDVSFEVPGFLGKVPLFVSDFCEIEVMSLESLQKRISSCFLFHAKMPDGRELHTLHFSTHWPLIMYPTWIKRKSCYRQSCWIERSRLAESNVVQKGQAWVKWFLMSKDRSPHPWTTSRKAAFGSSIEELRWANSTSQWHCVGPVCHLARTPNSEFWSSHLHPWKSWELNGNI